MAITYKDGKVLYEGAVLSTSVSCERVMSDIYADFATANATSERLEAELKAASAAMGAWKADLGPTGLTPDRVRATPEWKAAKAALDIAFARYRAFSAVYTRRFKREIALARDARRNAMKA